MNFLGETFKKRYRQKNKVRWDVWMADQLQRFKTQKPLFNLSALKRNELYEILHENGEPSYQEAVTTALLADKLLSYGLLMSGKSGMKNNETELIFSTSEDWDIAVRCDLDAISETDGYYHNCGHALNMVALTTLAQQCITEKRKGIGFIFQPAEEGPGNKKDTYIHPKGYGGGQYLREKGIYKNIDTLLSCHIDTSLKENEVRITPGAATAAAYRFKHISKGISAHAALPWQGKNPIEDSIDFLNDVRKLNEEMKKLPAEEYGLVSYSEIKTPDKELNSLPSESIIQGICRIVGEDTLHTIQNFMKKYRAILELEAPPVFNDPQLAHIAEKVAKENGFEVNNKPVRFRDETAWAGEFHLPWADHYNYPQGCKKILHFFTSGGENCGHLHNKDFNPTLEAIEWQVQMMYGIIDELLKKRT